MLQLILYLNSMHNSYRILILYFLVFSLLLLVSAILIYEHKIGLNIQDTLMYYIGNEVEFIEGKTLLGILKVNLAHSFVIALFVMILLHFLVFTKFKKQVRTLTYLMYILVFFELFSALFIIYGFEFFAFIKIFSFFTLIALILYVSFLLAKSILTR